MAATEPPALTTRPPVTAPASRTGSTFQLIVAAPLALCLSGFLSEACAQNGAAEFYSGKTINIVVGFGPGGGYDLHARLLARYLKKHVRGSPNVIVQNMAGAGGVRAANYVYSAAPSDGTYIAAVNEQAALYQLLSGKGVQYDASKFKWLGSIAHTNNTIYTTRQSGIDSLAKATLRETSLAGNGVVSAASTYGNVLNVSLGTKFKVINGYTGTNDSNLALERGEVDGGAGAYSSLLSSKPDWIREGLVKIIVQIGYEKEPDLPDVPLLLDVVPMGEAKQIAALVTLPTAIGFNHWVSPAVPDDRWGMLRAAYEATLRDPEMVSEAIRLQVTIRPKSGDELARLVQNAASSSRSVLDKTAQILGW